jgi:hypothetical protein
MMGHGSPLINRASTICLRLCQSLEAQSTWSIHGQPASMYGSYEVNLAVYSA